MYPLDPTLTDDAKRLAYVSCFIDEIDGVDIHDWAARLAAASGIEEPTERHYCYAVRYALDHCRAADLNGLAPSTRGVDGQS